MKNGSDVLSVAIRACKESCRNSEQRRLLLAISTSCSGRALIRRKPHGLANKAAAQQHDPNVMVLFH